MQVADIMSRDVQFVSPDATAQEAATLMGELDVGALPVGSPDDLQGIVTDRDLLFRVVADAREAGVRVREVMSRTVFTCVPADSIATAMDLMGAYHIRRLPVVDEARRVIGWVSLTDLSRRLLQDSGAIRQALEEVSGSPEVEGDVKAAVQSNHDVSG
jgi:CBS domain-containing protein